MAVHAISGADDDKIWEKMPYAIGLQYHAIWWEQYNNQRHMHAMGKVADIEVLRLDLPMEEEETCLIV